jgi:CubicO group peptidase (beta-lactamase class C family)
MPQRSRLVPTAVIAPALALAVLLATPALARASRAASFRQLDSLPRATPEAMGMSSAALDRATAQLQASIDAGEIAGVVAAVMRDGHLVYHVALGVRDVDAGDPMRKDALFRLYSMTRPVTSTAILLLQDEGRLSVHDPLTRWLPAFAKQPVLVSAADGTRRDPGTTLPPTRPRQGDITLAQLLTHTSGLGSRDAPLYRAHDVHRWDKSLAEVVDDVAALPLFEDPGTRYRYGLHAEVLGRVIEQASGQPVETFLRERLFTPLGMRDAGFLVEPDRAPRLATVHRKDASGRLRPFAMEPLDVTDDRTLVSAGVGLVASTEDMLRFGQLFLNEGRVGDRALLSPGAVRLARENAVPEALLPLPGGGYWAGSGWTLGGFAVALDPSRYTHAVRRGEFWWDGSAGTRFWIDPVERLVIVVMAQVSPAGGGGFRERFRGAVEEALVVRTGQ